MKNDNSLSTSRRQLLKYLVSSPVAISSVSTGIISRVMADELDLNPYPVNSYYSESITDLISSSDQALNVFDFERVARYKLPPAHYGYLATGVDDNYTLIENRTAFDRIKIRARKLFDTTTVDMSVNLFGETWPSPIALAPVCCQRSWYPEGDIATARASGETNSLFIYSTLSSIPIELVNETYKSPVWFQLYAGEDWNSTLKLIKRAETSGCKTMVFTVDMAGINFRVNRESLQRFIAIDNRTCNTCHTKSQVESKPLTGGMGYVMNDGLTWEYVKRLKSATKMNLLIKGIVTSEDARLCIDNGADGIIVSNHGGRALETGVATINCLEEITKEVSGKIPVLVDSGFRRGTDIFKALALGADGVCIGRPYIWGLASFGSDGVGTVIKILRAELELAMKRSGVRSISEITRRHVT